MKEQVRNYKQKSRHCGFDPQSPCYLQGIPVFAGMTALMGNGSASYSGLLRSARNDEVENCNDDSKVWHSISKNLINVCKMTS